MKTVTAKDLAMLGLDITRALATGTHSDIDIGMVARRADAGRLLASLETALGHDAWWAWLTDDQRAALDDEWAGIANNLTIEECGFTRTTPGLYFVMVLILEGIKNLGLPPLVPVETGQAVQEAAGGIPHRVKTPAASIRTFTSK